MNNTSAKAESAVVAADCAVEATDELLAHCAASGDEAAFEQLFERHRRRVARIVGRFFNRPERIEDIVQEVFLKMYFGLPDYSAERGTSFGAWLSRIAINCCYDQLRRAQRRPESSIDPSDEKSARIQLIAARNSADAESGAISRDLATKLLSRLNADDRLVLTLLEAEGMPIVEIAAVMGWSTSKVKVRAHRARRALRRVVSDFL